MPKQPGELYLELHVLYYEDEAVAAAGTEAELLFVRGLCFAKRLLTDGAIGEAQLRTISHGLSDPKAAAERLVSLRLWRRRKGGYAITNFLKRNQSRAEIAARSAEQSRYADKGNHLRWHQNSPRRDCEWCRQEPISRSPVGGRSGGRSGTRSGYRNGGESGREDRSTTESETTTETTTSTGTEKRGSNRARDAAEPVPAGASLFGIEPGDERRPVAEILAKRFRYRDVTEAQWARLDEIVDNEFPVGTELGRDRFVAWGWLADLMRKLKRDAGDPVEAALAEVNRRITERRSREEARIAEHEATKGAELHPSILATGAPGSRANGHAPKGASRETAIEFLRSVRGTLDAQPWQALLDRYGLTEADLDDDGPDFGAPEAAHV